MKAKNGRRLTVGAVQASPRFFDKRSTVEKACRFIAEAGRLGIDLLVFPEVFIAAYPY